MEAAEIIIVLGKGQVAEVGVRVVLLGTKEVEMWRVTALFTAILLRSLCLEDREEEVGIVVEVAEEVEQSSLLRMDRLF